MWNIRTRWIATLTGLTVAAVACGGNGSGSGSARISGNVSESSAAVREESRSWIAWVGQEVLGLARHAVAQAPGVTVTARSGGRRSSGTTGSAGEFDLPGAPTGDVALAFQDGGCSAEVDLPDVVAGSTLRLNDVALECDRIGSVGALEEVFPAVVQNVPSSPNGNLNVCVNSGGRVRTRVVKIRDATFEGGTFDDLQRGDRIEAEGEREGLGANSALDAVRVAILGPGSLDDCEGLPAETPTATPTSDPEASPTPTP